LSDAQAGSDDPTTSEKKITDAVERMKLDLVSSGALGRDRAVQQAQLAAKMSQFDSSMFIFIVHRLFFSFCEFVICE
jgi:hypothetical protein